MIEKKYSMTSQAVIGSIVLVLGLILTLGNFGIIEASAVLRYWPVLLLLFGGVKALQPGPGAGRLFGAAVAVLGVFLLLDRLEIVGFDVWALWPVLLMGIGASLVLKTRRRGDSTRGERSSGTVSGTAMLGGIEQRNSALDFRGGTVSAILGGHEIDLRHADIVDGGEAVLDVFAFMGGVEVKVPDDWTVALEGSAFLGGFENKTSGSDTRKKLILRGQAVLGGVEIRN